MKLIGYTVDEDELIISMPMTDFEALRQLLEKHKIKNNGIHQVLMEDFNNILEETKEE